MERMQNLGLERGGRESSTEDQGSILGHHGLMLHLLYPGVAVPVARQRLGLLAPLSHTSNELRTRFTPRAVVGPGSCPVSMDRPGVNGLKLSVISFAKEKKRGHRKTEKRQNKKNKNRIIGLTVPEEIDQP